MSAEGSRQPSQAGPVTTGSRPQPSAAAVGRDEEGHGVGLAQQTRCCRRRQHGERRRKGVGRGRARRHHRHAGVAIGALAGRWIEQMMVASGGIEA